MRARANKERPPLERRPFSRPFFIGRESKGRALCLDTVPDLVALGLIHEDPPADLIEGSTAATADVVTLGSRTNSNARGVRSHDFHCMRE